MIKLTKSLILLLACTSLIEVTAVTFNHRLAFYNTKLRRKPNPPNKSIFTTTTITSATKSKLSTINKHTPRLPYQIKVKDPHSTVIPINLGDKTRILGEPFNIRISRRSNLHALSLPLCGCQVRTDDRRVCGNNAKIYHNMCQFKCAVHKSNELTEKPMRFCKQYVAKMSLSFKPTPFTTNP